MRKSILFLLIIITLSFTLIACNTDINETNTNSYVTAFEAMKELRQNSKSRHVKTNGTAYLQGQIINFTDEKFYEGDILYMITDGDYGQLKRYYDYRNPTFTYVYTYDTEDGKWHREVNSFESSSGNVDFWDINNYDYKNGSFYLKSQYCIDDQISYKITIFNESSYEIRDEYTARSGGLSFKRVDVSIVSRFNESFNLKLPTNYVND
ncbi:MAG: hypothetical protein H6598_10020 [Flavobacteriales bacterium]|jgi:hypothetical protein|nr:hypothetical protein [Flavobacteriales bacterium]